MLGSSLHSIGQKRYHIDEIYIQTTTSGWTHVHDPSPRRLDEYRVVTYIGPALLKKNDEPVTGVIYDTYPNGQIKYKTRWKRGIKVGKSKRWYENGNINIISISSLNEKKRRDLYQRQVHEVSANAWKGRYYHENGNRSYKWRMVDLNDGSFNDFEKEWYENGQVKYKIVHHGKQNKTIDTSWYENGQVKKKVKWLNNSSTNECWDEDGNKIECD